MLVDNPRRTCFAKRETREETRERDDVNDAINDQRLRNISGKETANIEEKFSILSFKRAAHEPSSSIKKKTKKKTHKRFVEAYIY